MLPIDKTYLKTNLNNWKTLILDPAYIIQKATLPTATAQNLGVIYQYIGSASGLTKGGFYECQVVAGSDPAEYAWVEISTKTLTDNDTIQTNLQKQIYVPDATSSQKGVIKIGHGLETDNVSGQTGVVGFLEEIDELPTATSSNEGKIYLLTDVQTGYDRGGIYMCEESTETAGTYEWKLISMSPLEAGKGITIENDVISADTNIFPGTLDEWNALTEAEKAKYDFIASPEEKTIGKLHNNLYTLISSVALTTTATDYTLILNRKLSDYDYIIVQQYDATSMRNSMTIHLNQFKNKRVILNALHGTNDSSAADYSVSGINVQYVDDTTINAYATGSALINIVEVIGVKITQ